MTVSEPSQVQGEVGHTPGPWSVPGLPMAPDNFIVCDKDGGSIADFSPPGPWISEAEAEANARLGAAAPDLFKLLVELRNRCEGEICDGELLDRVDALLSSTRKDERA